MRDDIRLSLYSKIIFEILYVLATSIYIVLLNALNHELEQYSSNPFSVIGYNGGESVKFLIFAVIFIGVGVGLAVWFLREFNFYNYNDDGSTPFLILFLTASALNLLLVVLIIVFINNPILQAFLIVVFLGIGAFSAMIEN